MKGVRVQCPSCRRPGTLAAPPSHSHSWKLRTSLSLRPWKLRARDLQAQVGVTASDTNASAKHTAPAPDSPPTTATQAHGPDRGLAPSTGQKHLGLDRGRAPGHARLKAWLA